MKWCAFLHDRREPGARVANLNCMCLTGYQSVELCVVLQESTEERVARGRRGEGQSPNRRAPGGGSQLV